MDTEPSTSTTTCVQCNVCAKKFSCTKLLNRHMKRMHNIVECKTPTSYIICPLCENRNGLKTHTVLLKHLKEKHSIELELVTLQFSGIQDYEAWKMKEDINSNYAVQRTTKNTNHKEINYICNRSNYKGTHNSYLFNINIF